MTEPSAEPSTELLSGCPPEPVQQQLAELLRARPGDAVWEEVCALLEECGPDQLAAATPAVLRWPAAQRPMPDRWWAEWTRGEARPYHALAGTRALGGLDSVETGTVLDPVEEDWSGCSDSAEFREVPLDGGDILLSDEEGLLLGDEEHLLLGGRDPAGSEPEEGPAGMEHGAAAVAAPASLRWLAVGARAGWQDRGGDIVGWETTRDAPLVWFEHGGQSTDEPCDLQVSPDGEVVVASVQGSWLAWSAASGERLWRVGPELTGSGLGGAIGALLGGGSRNVDDPVRFGFSADGSRVAVGTCGSDVVAVVEVRTGRVLLRVPAGQDAFGPVALDTGGRLLAHAGPGGRVVVREVAGGAVLAAADTGLTSVGALAVAPDGGAVFAVGGSLCGAEEDAGLAVRARPAGRLLELRPDGAGLRLEPGELLRPPGCPGGIDADSQLAAASARACWVGEVPYAFLGADFGSVLFDGRGRTLWADPAAAVASFTPDGRALVVVQDEISAWFLAGLAPPAEPAEPGGRPGAADGPAPLTAHASAPVPCEPVPGEALLTRLPLPGSPPELPCSYWPVRLAAVSDDVRTLVFSTQLDRGAARRRQVVCRWPDDGPPGAVLLPTGDSPAAALSALVVSPDGRLVARAVLSDGERLLLDDLETGSTRWRYTLPPCGRLGPRRLHLAFSADGGRVAVAADDGRSVVLDTENGTVVGEFREPGPMLQGLALDASGELVAHGMGHGRGRLVVRRVADGAPLLEAGPKELRQLTGLAFAPDGDQLAAVGATYGRDAALWTLALTGDDPAPAPRIAVHDLPMSDQPHGALVWPPTGLRAAFPGSRGAGVVWDAVTGRVLADVPFGEGEGAVALSPNGRTLVTVTQAGARRWRL